MKAFYYVYRVGDRAPTIKHATISEAHAEATRLATQHPSSTFEILQCLGITQTFKPSTVWLDGYSPSNSF